MKLAIMQPYFIPYLGYFSLIKQTNQFILFDTVQFIRHGWIERNRILKPEKGWQYINVPLRKRHKHTIIKDVEIDIEQDWRSKIFRQLEHYKKRVPYYKETIEILELAFRLETSSIVKLNENILRTICNYIGIIMKINVFSEMNLAIEAAKTPDEWALNICNAMENVSEYWNPEGGVEFFDRSKYISAGIDIKFLKMNNIKYPQYRQEFEPFLSIIDVMMFNEPEKIYVMLDDYVII